MDLSGLTELLKDALPLMLKGALWTLVLAIASVFFGALIGTLVAITRLAKVPLLARLASLYVSCMRGTPLLVQLFVIYFGLPSIGLPPMGLVVAIYALTLIASLAGDQFQLKGVLVLATVLSVGSYLAFVVALNLQFPVWPTFITG